MKVCTIIYMEENMELEELGPVQYSRQMQKRLVELRSLFRMMTERLQNTPFGHLRISQRKGHPEFYHVTENGGSRGHYIPAARKELALQLAQKDYDEKLLKLLRREIWSLENYLRLTADGNPYQKLYEGLCSARQSLIEPVTLSDCEYAEQWKLMIEQDSGNKGEALPFAEDSHTYYTANGERVRSKSEVIIADYLLRNGVPYKYEIPLKLKRESMRGNGGAEWVTFHPDFICLNVRTRGEFYWEHFGKMDDADYKDNAVGKLNLYAENGFLTGRNLIFTMESGEESLDTRVVEKMIKEFLV